MPTKAHGVYSGSTVLVHPTLQSTRLHALYLISLFLRPGHINFP